MRLLRPGGGSADAAIRTRRLSLQEMDSSTGVFLFVGEVVLLLAAWQFFIGTLEWINPLFLPPPSQTLEGMSDIITHGELVTNAVPSLIAWFTGFGVAAVVGIVGGLIVGSSIPADRLTAPILWTIYATPWLAYRPLSTAWFGFGLTPIIFLIFIASMFPILFNTSAGIRTTSRSVLNAGRVFGASRWELYRKILFPSTVPYMIAGLRQGAVLATIALIVAEMTGPSRGMGALLIYKANTFETGQSFAAIVVVVLWSVGISQLIKVIGHRIAPWMVGGGH